MQEEWKAILGYGKYSVSNFGNVRNDYTGRAIKGCNNNGYRTLGLYNGKSQKTFLVHRLVACAFLSPVENMDVVNHIDCNRSNNRVDNLEWLTRGLNNKHTASLGRMSKGILRPQHKLSEEDVVLIKDMICSGLGNKKIGPMFGVSHTAIKHIRTGRNWKHILPTCRQDESLSTLG